MKLDTFFTPPSLAAAIVRALEVEAPEAIVDPAAGDGALLLSAATRWPNARILAGDIDRTRVAGLATNTDWDVCAGDFLDGPASRVLIERSAEWRTTSVLLNPPFSYRGGQRWTVTLGSEHVMVASRAMAFLACATRLVGVKGQLAALMPAGSLTSERDAQVRAWLAECGNLEELERPSKWSFQGVVSQTVIVRWTPRSTRRKEGVGSVTPRIEGACNGIQIVRGTRQMHRRPGSVDEEGVPLIHTTNLVDGSVVGNAGRFVPSQSDRVVHGPVVLIPRVGRPDRRKVVVHNNGPITLSDCVFAIQCRDMPQAVSVRQRLVDNFADVGGAYGGTGAPYLTMQRLRSLVHEFATPRAE